MLSRVQFNSGAATVSYDPEKWGAPETDNEGLITLDHNGPGSAVLIAERLGVPADRASDGLIEEFQKKHPETKVLLREKRTVNGHEVVCLKLSFTVTEIPLILYLYCFGGLSGTMQVRTCVEAPHFEQCESDFGELLNSLEIRPTKHAGLVRMWQSMRFARLVLLLALPVIGITFLRFWLRAQLETALWVAAALAAGIFLFAWLFDLIKFRLK